VVQYRTYCLIKWKGYGEDRDTWEVLEPLSDDA
jgi:hypothetical protein